MASSGETLRNEGAEVLRVENLTVRYGALIALRDVSWSVRSGEILGIIGPNGAGKSSCFAAVTNAAGHSGQTFLDNTDVSLTKTFDLASRGLRRTFQQNSFFGELTVLQNAVAAIVREYSASLTASLLLRLSAYLIGFRLLKLRTKLFIMAMVEGMSAVQIGTRRDRVHPDSVGREHLGQPAGPTSVSGRMSATPSNRTSFSRPLLAIENSDVD